MAEKKGTLYQVNDEHALMRFEFMEMVMRIAILKYGKGQATNDLSEAIEMLIQQNILPHLPPIAQVNRAPTYKKQIMRKFLNSMLRSAVVKYNCSLPDVFLMVNVDSLMPPRKQDRALWHGKCGYNSCHASNPRMQLAANVVHQKELFDVKFIGKGCKSEDLNKWSGETDCKWLTPEVRADIQLMETGPMQSNINFCKSRYLINMPGAAKGSYSRNLQYILPCASAVLMWDKLGAYEEWYYRSMRPGKEFVWCELQQAYTIYLHISERQTYTCRNAGGKLIIALLEECMH
eukprot:gene3790-4742_t